MVPIALASGVTPVFSSAAQQPPIPVIAANDNLIPAGNFNDGILNLRLAGCWKNRAEPAISRLVWVIR